MKYIIQQYDQRYIEANSAFELRENGTPSNLVWHIYFNGGRIGTCAPAADSGPYKIHTAKGQLVGEFDSYIEGCEALRRLTVSPTIPSTEPSAATPTQTLNATQVYATLLNLLKDLEAFVDVQNLKLSFDRSHRAYLSGQTFEEEIIANFALHRLSINPRTIYTRIPRQIRTKSPKSQQPNPKARQATDRRQKTNDTNSFVRRSQPLLPAKPRRPTSLCKAFLTIQLK